MVINLFSNFKMRYNNINLLHFTFYYINKLALLFAQQCQALIFQRGFLHSFTAAAH